MSNDLKKQLGNRIKELRMARNLKQCELADLLDMERSHFTRLENGKHMPSSENLIKISKILQVKMKDLFDFGHEKPQNILTKEIIESLSELNEKEIQYLYKTIDNIRQLRK